MRSLLRILGGCDGNVSDPELGRLPHKCPDYLSGCAYSGPVLRCGPALQRASFQAAVLGGIVADRPFVWIWHHHLCHLRILGLDWTARCDGSLHVSVLVFCIPRIRWIVVVSLGATSWLLDRRPIGTSDDSFVIERRQMRPPIRQDADDKMKKSESQRTTGDENGCADEGHNDMSAVTTEEAQGLGTAVPSHIVVSARLAETFGYACWLLAMEHSLRGLSLAQVEAMLGPPISMGQARIYRSGGVPAALATWAYLSDEALERLQDGASAIRAEDWRSGSNLRVVHLTGTEKARALASNELSLSLFEGGSIRFLVDQDAIVVEVLSPDLLAVHGRELVELARCIHGESRRRIVAFDDAGVISLMDRVVSDGNQVAFVALAGGKPVGVFGGRLERAIYGAGRIAVETALAVAPRYRNRDVATRLVTAFSRWAELRGASEVLFIQSSAIAPEAAERVYGAVGAGKVGAIYSKFLNKPLRTDAETGVGEHQNDSLA